MKEKYCNVCGQFIGINPDDSCTECYIDCLLNFEPPY